MRNAFQKLLLGLMLAFLLPLYGCPSQNDKRIEEIAKTIAEKQIALEEILKKAETTPITLQEADLARSLYQELKDLNDERGRLIEDKDKTIASLQKGGEAAGDGIEALIPGVGGVLTLAGLSSLSLWLMKHRKMIITMFKGFNDVKTWLDDNKTKIDNLPKNMSEVVTLLKSEDKLTDEWVEGIEKRVELAEKQPKVEVLPAVLSTTEPAKT